MEWYLGEVLLKQEDTEFKEYSSSDWAMYFIESYGGIDGAEHKDWTLDQVARILKGCEIIIKQASWENGQTEYRITTGKPTSEYNEWVNKMVSDGYEHSTGGSP